MYTIVGFISYSCLVVLLSLLVVTYSCSTVACRNIHSNGFINTISLVHFYVACSLVNPNNYVQNLFCRSIKIPDPVYRADLLAYRGLAYSKTYLREGGKNEVEDM